MNRRAVNLAYALGAMDRVTMYEEPVRAIHGLDHPMNAEEAARGLDDAQPWLPKTGDDERTDHERREARRILPLQQHETDQGHQHDPQCEAEATAEPKADNKIKKARQHAGRERRPDAPEKRAHAAI